MILVLNCGSQSIKWKLFDDKLGTARQNKLDVLNSGDYEKILMEEIKNLEFKNLKIDKVGHRVVHGGQFFAPLKITDENLEELEKLNSLAPLHNPYNIMGIKACRETFPQAENIGIFDTEFFANLPEKAFTCALPENISKEMGFRRYGFHGISHEFVAKKGAQKIRKNFNKLKIITVHLGGGASATAIKNGVAIDTSMGFTPMEGLVMMTRPGNIDGEIVLQICERFGAKKAREILNAESGLRGICGEGDMLRVLDKTRNPEESERRRAELALDVFIYSAQKYIGAYYTVLGDCDLLVFTGAIGFGSPQIRNIILKDLKALKIKKVLAIETDEEFAIAQKIFKL